MYQNVITIMKNLQIIINFIIITITEKEVNQILHYINYYTVITVIS